MFKASENLWASFMKQDGLGAWVDMVMKYEDGTSTTWSNAPMGQDLDHRPGHDKVYDKELGRVSAFTNWSRNRAAKDRGAGGRRRLPIRI